MFTCVHVCSDARRGVHGVCVHMCSGVCVVSVWCVVCVEGACVSVFKGVFDNRETTERRQRDDTC